MNEKRKLIIIQFSYNNRRYLLPRLLKVKNELVEKDEIEFYQKLIKKLEELSFFQNVKVLDGSIDDLKKQYEEFYKILNAPNPNMKYLKIDTGELVPKSIYQFFNDTSYDFYFTKFPVRIVNYYDIQQITDEELPIVELID